MAKVRRLTAPNVEEDTEQLEFPYLADGDAKWYSHFGNQYGGILSSYPHITHATQQCHC